EDYEVWAIETLDDGVRGEDVEDAELHEPDEGGKGIDDKVLADLRLLPDLDSAQAVGCPGPDVLLVEAFLRHALGAADERRRPVLQTRQDPVGDRFVEEREVALHRLLDRVEDTIGVGEANARDHGLPGRVGGCRVRAPPPLALRGW